MYPYLIIQNLPIFTQFRFRDVHAVLHSLYRMVVALIIASRLIWQNQFPTLHQSPRRPLPASSSDVTTDFFSRFCISTCCLLISYVMSRGNTQDPNTVFTPISTFMLFTLSARLYQMEGEYFQEHSSPDLVFVLSLVCTQWTPARLVSTSRDQRKRRERRGPGVSDQ